MPADSLARIPAALKQVEPGRRPGLSPDLFAFYANLFPGRPVAVCCFDNADAAEAKPFLL